MFGLYSDCESYCGLLNLLNRKGWQTLNSDCEVYGLAEHDITSSECIRMKNNGLTRSDGIIIIIQAQSPLTNSSTL